MNVMGLVRPFVKQDVSDIAELYHKCYQKCYLDAGGSSSSLRAYIDEVFFHSPWHDRDCPSLVYQANNGRIVGFLGVIPRRMSANGRPIRVMVSSSFMVEPGSRSTLAAIELLRQFLRGPQDLSMTDGANDVSRQIWEAMGGTAASLNSLNWTRLLRPSRYAIYLLEKKRPKVRPFTILLKPIGGVLDGIAAKVPPNRFRTAVGRVLGTELDVDAFLDCLSKLSDTESVRPEYDRHSLTWLFEMAARKNVHGAFRKVLLRTEQGKIVGWWLSYLSRGGVSQVVQFGARKESVHAVLNHLFHEAWKCGSIAISGRLQPRFVQALSENYCSLWVGSWTLVHSRDPELLQAVHRGDAMLTRLEGEWWTAFLEHIPNLL